MNQELTDQQIEQLARKMRDSLYGECTEANWNACRAGYIRDFRNWLSAIRRAGYQVGPV